MLPLKDSHINEYLKYKRSFRLSPLTHLKTNIELDLFMRYLRSKNIDSINVVDEKVVRQYLSSARKTKFWLTRRVRSFVTIAYKRVLLWNYFEYLCQMQFRADNPVRSIPTPLLPKKVPEFLSLRQAVKLLKFVVKNKKKPHQYQIRGRAYIALILFYGLENHEIFRIKLKDLDFKQKTMKIRKTHFHDSRTFPLFPPVDKWLLAYKRIRPIRRSDRFFQNVKTSSDCGFMTTRGYLQVLSRKMRLKLSSKILRSTFFSFMYDGNVNHRVIQAIIGCHTIETIERRSVIASSRKKAAVETLSTI